MGWIDTAKKLPIGGKAYTEHEGCTTSKKLWIYRTPEGVGCFCNKCGYKSFSSTGLRNLQEVLAKHGEETELVVNDVTLPEDFTADVEEFSQEALLWLYKADVRNHLINAYGIGYSKELNRVIIPVYDEHNKLVMWQGRGLSNKQTKYLNTKSTKKQNDFFKSWAQCNTSSDDPYSSVVVVEDALSVIKVGQITKAVGVLGTSLSQKQINYLSKFSLVIFWLDGDRAGVNASTKMVKKLSMVTNTHRIFTKKDPKKLSYAEIEEIINSARHNTTTDN